MTGPAPTGPPDRRGGHRGSVGAAGRLLGLLRPQWIRLVGLAAAGLGFVAAAVTVPRLLGAATDVVVTAAAAGARLDPAALCRPLGAAVGVALLGAGAGIAQGRLTAVVVYRAAADLRGQVQAALARLPLRRLDRMAPGDLLSRVTTDVDAAAQFLQQVLDQIVWAAVLVVAVLVVMVWLSPVLCLVVALTVPLAVIGAAMLGRRAQRAFTAQAAAAGTVAAALEQAYAGHSTLWTLGRTGDGDFATANAELHAATRRAQVSAAAIGPVTLLVANLTYVAVAVVGSLHIAAGTTTVGVVGAFIVYAREFSQPVSQTASAAAVVQSGLTSAARVFALLDLAAADGQQAPVGPDPDPGPGAGPAPSPGDGHDGLATVTSGPGGTVVFEAVRFAYRPTDRFRLELDLTVPCGQTVAVVGATGAGKTTLAALLLGLYEPDAGRVLIDGSDLATLDPGTRRATLGLVPSEPWLFEGTIADNIGYGDRTASRDRIVAAARATLVDPFVATLPDGYDTWIGRDGPTLSAGQRQLVAIARAQLQAPAVLVLDEATGSLDPATERRLRRALAVLRAGRTSVVIAHRAATVSRADLVVVLDAGRVVARGAPAELARADGAYGRIFEGQSGSAGVSVDVGRATNRTVSKSTMNSSGSGT